MLPREVILAIVLVDLPIDLDQKGRSSYNDGCGASWAYLSCECDDFYSDIVNEVISLCSFAQIRSLCLFCEGKKEMVLARSTPKCKNALLRALRVIGRYEFVESAPVYSDAKIGVTAFNALDFGNPNNPLPEGRRVLMKCFTNEEHYRRNVSLSVSFLVENRLSSHR